MTRYRIWYRPVRVATITAPSASAAKRAWLEGDWDTDVAMPLSENWIARTEKVES